MAKKNNSSAAKTFAHPLSMTGFGKASIESRGIMIEVEIKCTNHRFFDPSIRLPKDYACFEGVLRSELAQGIERGHVDVFVLRRKATPARPTDRKKGKQIAFNAGLCDSLMQIQLDCYNKYSKEVKGKIPDSVLCTMLSLAMGRHEVLSLNEGDFSVDDEQPILFQTFRNALTQVMKMRQQEGQQLSKDLESRLIRIKDLRAQIERQVSTSSDKLTAQLKQRLAKMTAEIEIDSKRLEQEVALLVDRADVTEELVRIESHLKQFSGAMAQFPQGKRLDFLLQEFGREFNTIASKAQDSTVQTLVVDAKVELEKMREQVQNIV